MSLYWKTNLCFSIDGRDLVVEFFSFHRIDETEHQLAIFQGCIHSAFSLAKSVFIFSMIQNWLEQRSSSLNLSMLGKRCTLTTFSTIIEVD
jgi:hypothetical protein